MEHFVFGFGTSLIVSWLLRFNHKSFSIPLIVILLWEVLEFRQDSAIWIHTIGNNIVDILIGLLGIFLGNWIFKMKLKNENSN